MSEVLELRRGEPEDAAACAEIVAGWLAESPWMPAPPTRAALEAALAEGIPKREVWVIGTPVAGYVSFEPARAQIHGLYVRDRGAGLGKALVDRVKEGRDYVQLRTHAPNTAAHRFYAREGFVAVEDIAEGSDGIPEIRMEWHR